MHTYYTAFVIDSFHVWTRLFYMELFMLFLASTKHKNVQYQQIHLPQIIHVILQLHKPRQSNGFFEKFCHMINLQRT